MTTPEQPDTLLEFPCEYPLKAMGETSADFEAIVIEIVSRYVRHIPENAVSSRQSSGSKFTSVTVTIQATSKAQLDAIYQDLTDDKRIKYAL